MKADYTHISVVLDRTGSMESIRDDVVGGFNAYISQQKAEPGSATVTLVQFDTQDPYEVIHRFKPIGEVPALTRETYVPRASTPLLDAMGRGINDLEQSVHALPEEERPDTVILVIVTDGHENSSKEFRKDQIEKMIREKSEKDGWQIVFLSADLAAIHEARALGIDPAAALLFAKDKQGNAAAWDSLSRGTAAYRARRAHKFGFQQDDRQHPDDPEKKKT